MGKKSCIEGGGGSFSCLKPSDLCWVATLSGIQGQLRRDKIIELQNCLAQQQCLFKSSVSQSGSTVGASYVIV